MHENNKNSINSDIGLVNSTNAKLPEKTMPSSASGATPSVGTGNTRRVRRDMRGGRINRKRIATLRKMRKKVAIEQPPPKKMTGPGFYMVVGFAFIKDLIDLAGLTGFGLLLTSFLGFILVFIVWFYFFYTGVKYFEGRKLATFIISAIIEITPGLNFFPTFSITLFIIKELENNPKLKKLTKLAKGKI